MVNLIRPEVIIGIFVSHIQFAICTVYCIQTESNNQLEIIESSCWILVNMLHERKWEGCRAVEDLWTNLYQVDMSFFTHSLKVSSSQRSIVPTSIQASFYSPSCQAQLHHLTLTPHPQNKTFRKNQLIFSDLGWKTRTMELLFFCYNQINFPAMIERKSFHQRINCVASARSGLAGAVCVHFFQSIRFIFDHFPAVSPNLFKTCVYEHLLSDSSLFLRQGPFRPRDVER